MSRRFVPELSDAVFGLVLATVLFGGRHALLNDPGTPWHLRLGRDIVVTGGVPRHDSLTFTRAGDEWVDQSWLFDVILAFVVDHRGWSAAVALSALGLATVYAGLARGLEADGRSAIVVLAVALLAAGVGAIHFLVRPHLFTLGFFLITARFCQKQHERGGRIVFLAPLVMIVWANVHGGFLAGPVIVFTAAAAHSLSGAWNAERRREVAVFVAAGVLCLVAATLNPYGFGLYRHVGRLLVSSRVTDLIDEYQPIPFGKPTTRAVELVVLILIAVPTLSRGRMTRYELVHSLVWLHLSLASVRNAPLFALAVAPGLARMLDILKERDRAGNEPRVPAWSAWPPLAALGLGTAVCLGWTIGGFDRGKWPLSALPTLERLPVGSPLFHEQDWGGLVEAESRPRRPAFIDDRFELFGREMVLQYVNALDGGPDWETLRDANGIELVWVRPDRGLVRRLENDPDWQVRFRDGVSVLFQRGRRDAALTRAP